MLGLKAQIGLDLEGGKSSKADDERPGDDMVDVVLVVISGDAVQGITAN
jgi:hypothetical protein